VGWLSAWLSKDIASLSERDADEAEGKVRALCKVAILAVVPWRCLGVQSPGGVVSRFHEGRDTCSARTSARFGAVVEEAVNSREVQGVHERHQTMVVGRELRVLMLSKLASVVCVSRRHPRCRCRCCRSHPGQAEGNEGGGGRSGRATGL
jgi:cobalamin biosynthesis protein CobD/CbiB